jgi:hypothetical protein
MEAKLITLPTTTPVSLQEAKDHLYLTSDSYNDELARKLDEAVDFCQRRITGRRQFSSATYDMIIPAFPYYGFAGYYGVTAYGVNGINGTTDDRVELPYPPLVNVSSIRYYNSTGGLAYYGSSHGSTASSTAWIQVIPGERPGYVIPAFGKVWPVTRVRPDAVTIRFVAGSTTPATVPASIKAAVKLKLEHLWDPERIDEVRQSAAIDSLLACNDYGHYG